MFIDLKKAFDTVNHGILLKKLDFYKVKNTELKWFADYLSNRLQYAEVEGKSGHPMKITCGVPQGSILGPLLFLIYINDLGNISSKMSTLLYADDTTFVMSGKNNIELFETANQELALASNWFFANKLTLHPGKTRYIKFFPKKDETLPVLKIIGHEIMRVGEGKEEESFKYVGVEVDENLTWKHHISKISNKIRLNLFLLKKERNFIPKKTRLMIYNSLIRPHLEYCINIFSSCNITGEKSLFQMQKKAVRMISNKKYNDHTEPIFKELNLLNFEKTKKYNILKLAHEIFYKTAPEAMNVMFPRYEVEKTRSECTFVTPLYRTSKLQSFPSFQITKQWNDLFPQLRKIEDKKEFLKKLKEVLLSEE